MAKKFYYNAPVVEGFENEHFATTSVKLTKKDVALPITVNGEDFDDQKFTPCCKREVVTEHDSLESLDSALKERWNGGLQDILDIAYAAIFTRPDYQQEAKEAIEANDYEAAAKAAQNAIDEYKLNVKKERKTVTKAQAQKVNSLEAKAAELGITLDELIARASAL